MESATVLLCCAGSRVHLVESMRAAGLELGISVRVIATDPAPALSAACCVADASYTVVDGRQPEFVEQLLEVCRSERVRLILPLIDPDLMPLSENVEKFLAMGTTVAVSAQSVVAMARDKLKTARFLSAGGIPTPHTTPLSDFMHEPERLSWPVIAKPIGGTSSVGIIKPRRVGELSGLDDSEYIVQEIWRGREYTVNLYFDLGGRLRCAIPHWRIEVRSGVVTKARTERVPVLLEIAERLAGLLAGARGPLCFQAMVDEAGRAAVFEVNARIGGGYALAHAAGANFMRWLLEETLGRPCTATQEWQEGKTMLSYELPIVR